MDRAVTDIIDLIDQVTAPTCGWCQTPLRPDGPSRDFCGEVCQAQWTLRCASRDADVDADEAAFALATGGLIPSPAEFRPQRASHVPSIAYDDHPWHTRFGSEQPTFLPTTPLPGFRMELTDGRRWPAQHVHADGTVHDGLAMRCYYTPPGDGSWDVTEQRPPWQQSAIRDSLLAAITRLREALLPEPRTIEMTREQWETMRSQEPSMRGLDRGPLPGDQIFGRQIVMVDRHEDSTIGQGQAARPYRDMRHCP